MAIKCSLQAISTRAWLLSMISAWLNVKSEVWWIAKVSEDTAHLTSSRYPSIPLFVIHAPRWINQSCVLSAKIYYDLVPFPLALNQFARFCCCVIKNSIYLSNRHIYTSHDTADSLETIIIIRTSKEEKKSSSHVQLHSWHNDSEEYYPGHRFVLSPAAHRYISRSTDARPNDQQQ